MNLLVSRSVWRTFGLWTAALWIGAGAASAAEPGLEQRLERLEQENATLKQEVEALKSKTAALTAPETPRAEPRSGPTLGLGGQYRINSYSVDNDTGGDRQNASRVRIRQNIDLAFDPQFKTHLQLELGHTTDNVTTTTSSSRSTRLAVRHAVLDYTPAGGANLQAGIVPLSDSFGDTQFSSDWDYNPVALAVRVPFGPGTLRAFAGNLAEGDEAVAKDDFVHYQFDYRLPLRGRDHLDLAVTLADVSDGATPPSNRHYASYGAGGRFDVGPVSVHAFALGARTDRALLGTTDDAKGVAAKLEFTGKIGQGDFGLLFTRATGEADGSGFLPIMALAKTNGYWGYTGLLTIQGPTDTGFDGDSVNIGNNGYGLTSVQAKYRFPISERLSGYVAAGWFGGADTPAGRGDDVGSDLLLMGTYRFNKILVLDFGAGHAQLKDALSGYAQGVIGGAAFNQAPGTTRTKTALFSRLQAEF